MSALKNITFYYTDKLSNGELSNLKSVLMQCYIEFQNLEGKYVFTPKEATSKIWDTAAKICEEYKVKPYRFIELCYNNCKARHTVMRSYMLASTVMRKLCEEDNNIGDEFKEISIEDYVNNSIKFAANLIKLNQDDPFFVLKSPGYAIEPWVRICLCNGNETVISRYKKKADEQMKSIKGLFDYINTKTKFKYKYD